MSRQRGRERSGPSRRRECEAEVVPGLEEFAQTELLARFGSRISWRARAKAGNIPFSYTGNLRELLSLRTVGSVYLVRRFEIPRPLALLGHQHFEALVVMIGEVAALHPSGTFRTFRISAAGEDSRVFERIRRELAARTGLEPSRDAGDLLLRVRRPLAGGTGFEVSVRLSPRPLSARPWRVCDMPGALNATVASVMAQLMRPSPDDFFLNLACGSGSIIVERLELGPAREALGVDIDPEALRCARANLEAAGRLHAARLEQWDAADLPLGDGCATALCADLPFGHLVGSHAANEALYPRILAEAGRVAALGARCVLITSEARLLERAVGEYSGVWSVERTFRISLDSLQLRIFVLARQP